MNLEIFGKEIPLRSHYCQLYSEEPKEVKEPYISIFVRFKGCNAKCTFCEFADTANHFNMDKYLSILDEIGKKIYIKKVAFTGGEPTLNFKLFKDVVVNTRQKLDLTSFVLNTNGLNLEKLYEDDVLPLYLNNISLSRHHYDDKLNNHILGFESISNERLKALQERSTDKDLIHLSCNTIKGFIDTKEEVFNFLEYAHDIDIRSVGLVSLMPINDYCKENFVDVSELGLLSERFNITREHKYKNMCKCKNYVYIPESNDNTVKVYYKNACKPSDIVENLVYDGEFLRVGFAGDILL